MKRRQKIKEWEIETGIKLRNLNGFQGEKNKIHSKRYTKEQFRIAAEKCEITIKTNKGVDFLLGQTVRDEQWKSYIEHNENNRFKRNKYEKIQRNK